MKKSVAVAALYLSDEVLASFVADTEDEVMLKVKDFIVETYTSAADYDLSETLDVFLKDHSLKIVDALVVSARDADEIKFVAVLDYPGTYQMLIGHTEDAVCYEVDMFLGRYWHKYDPAVSAMDNFEALEEEHGYEAFTYQYVTN